jgi:hypothetical protein
MTNLMATMMLGGLWHGAGWTFVAWGALHGAGLAVNHVWTRGPAPAGAGGMGGNDAVRHHRLGAVPRARLPHRRACPARHGRPGRAGACAILDAAVFWVALAVALVGPSSQDAMLRMLRPSPLVAVPAAIAFVFLLLLIGGRIRCLHLFPVLTPTPDGGALPARSPSRRPRSAQPSTCSSPWSIHGTCSLSPPWHRIPISSNARYSMPALAISPRFDSAMVGTSTGRLLQPAILDAPFDAHFVNLAMNSATPWEQGRILRLFLRHHPTPRGADRHRRRMVLRRPARPVRTQPADAGLDARGLTLARLRRDDDHVCGAGSRQPVHVADRAQAAALRLRRLYQLVPPDSRYDPRRVDELFRTWAFDMAKRTVPPPPPPPSRS